MPSFAPTKSVLQQVRRTLSFAQEGHELLEQKREFLVLELMHYVNRVRILEKEFSRKNEELRKIYALALFHSGIRALIETGSSVRPYWRVGFKETTVMGLKLPEAHLETTEKPVYPAGMSGGAAFDELGFAVHELLSTLVELAAVKTAVWQLAREVKKTQRRVNALDRIVIPENESMEKFIIGVLEESERAAFFVQKRLREAR